MGLNISKGNMYEFVTHTWNTVKGECHHDCSYCYMKRWGKLNPARFDAKELKTDLGDDNFIFVGSGNDLFSACIPDGWIDKTLEHCDRFHNKYLFQTKNPVRFKEWMYHPVIRERSVLCTTIETNRHYPDIMKNSPNPLHRAFNIFEISKQVDTYITTEPIMDFDLPAFFLLLTQCKAKQINIGADSGGHNLPEPSAEKVISLIKLLRDAGENIVLKPNIQRIIGSAYLDRL